MKDKILVSPSSFGQVSSAPVDLLRKHDFEIVDNPFGRKLTEDEVIQLGKDCVGIVAGVEPLTARVMDELPGLKCISRVGVGMDNVDLEYAKSKNIAIHNTPDGPTRAVAELTIGMTLALLRRIPQADANLKKKIWKKETGNLLFGKKVGIVGLGRIGRLVAELFRGLGNTVVGFDPFIDRDWASKNHVEILAFDDVLSVSDIVTLHVSSGKNKAPLIGEKELNLLKREAFLINIARGGVVDEDALYKALSTGHLGGAAIDVFSAEPYEGPLCTLENVVLTPHLGSYAKEGKVKMEEDAAQNLINALR
ncbi:MAG: phosphoglycerate dehydrogenase [Deltaproteobacteria bacterium]